MKYNKVPHRNSAGKIDCYIDELDEASYDALVSGEREPEDKHDLDVLDFLGGPRPKPWPIRWQKCKRCGVEWNQRGAPWPHRMKKMIPVEPGDSEPGYVINGWIYQMYCDPCLDWLTSFHSPPAMTGSEMKKIVRNDPFSD